MIGQSTFGWTRMAVMATALLGLLAVAAMAILLWQPAPALAQSPPDAVGSITLTRSGSTLTVSWNAVSGAAKYHALYQADGAGDWLPPIPDYQNITATSFSFDIDSSKSYVVGVRAGNSAGWGPWTDSPASHPSLPAAVGSITLTRSDTTLTVSWNAVDGAAKYHALYQADGAGDWLPPITDYKNITDTGFTFDVDNGKSYVVGVRGGNSAGWGPWTDSPASGPYTPVQQITVTATRGEDGDTAGVSWDAYAGDSFEYYRVIVCDDSQYNDASCVGTVWTSDAIWDVNSTGPVAVPDLDPGTGYGVILQTWRNGSAMKSHATLPAGPAAPTNLSVTPGNGSLNVAWNAVSGATGYDVRAKKAGSSDWHDVASNVTTTSHRYTTDATIDYVAVRARNANGPGNWTETSRLPASDWLNTVQQSGASSQSGSIAAKLAKPASVTVTRDNYSEDEKLHVTWAAVTGAGGYNLTCSDADGWGTWWSCGSVNSGTTTTFTIDTNSRNNRDLVWTRSYLVAVRAVNNTPSDGSDWTAASNARPALQPTKQLNSSHASAVWFTRGAGSISLSWISPLYGKGYEIECATGTGDSTYTLCADVEDANVDTGGTITATITSWTAGGADYTINDASIYDIKVRTTNEWGSSPYTLAPLIHPIILLTVSDVGLTTATLTIANHTGNWYYRHTGAGATCEGPVSTTSKALTGLTTNTDYTYSAYSDSNCTTGNLLAAATEFTTRSSVSNLDSSEPGPGDVSAAKRQAVAFTTGTHRSGYVLKDITLSLRSASAAGGTNGLQLKLHAMAGTGQYSETSAPSTTALATLSGTAPTASTWTDTTFTCSGSGCSLSKEKVYFVVATFDGTGKYEWAYALTETQTAQPSDNGWDVEFGHYKEDSPNPRAWASWSDYNLAEIVFENIPNPELTASNVGATTATLTIAHHTGNWYYKHTGAGATCDGPVTGTSKALTGLTANTTYTYSAYSDSSCTTGNLLAKATGFTTFSSVSNLGSTKSGDAPISGQYKGAVAFTTGSNSSGYVLKSVTMPLRKKGGPHGVTATLHAMQGTGEYSSLSEADATVLATLAGTAPTSSTWSDTTFTCAGNGCKLSSDTTYFVVLTTFAFPGYAWAYARSETETALPSGNGWNVEFGHYKDSTYPWGSHSFWNVAEIAFVNAPSLTTSNVAATTATLTIADHTGAWYYQHTNTGATCDGPVSGTSKDLTGLTANTSYTYSAYSDSGCTSGNLLATAAQFTTQFGNVTSTSNLDETVGALFTIGSSTAHAQEFTTGNTTGVYKLSSVKVNFTLVGNASAVTVAIHDKQSNGTPATTARTTLTGTAASGQAEFTCSTNCELDANTSYFVHVSATSDNAAYPSSTASDAQTLYPNNNGWSIANAARSQSGSWAEVSNSHAMMIDVGATIHAKLTAGSVTTTTAALTIARHTGAWWYERTAPTGDTTCHSVASGTTTASLSSLTANTSYTYKAYDQSGCNSADEIATATFTTPSS